MDTVQVCTEYRIDTYICCTYIHIKYVHVISHVSSDQYHVPRYDGEESGEDWSFSDELRTFTVCSKAGGNLLFG